MKKYLLSFVFITCMFYTSVTAQERKLIYDVMRNGKVIGTINFVELVKGKKKFISMTSDVKTTYILPFSDNTVETAGYENGVMVYSSYYQKQSGSGETNKSTIASGKMYKVTDDGKTKLVNMGAIKYNMLLLYTDMPVSITKVYSANYQKMADLKKVEENKYKLTLPDGKNNFYTYKNGLCTKVEVVRTLFSIEFVLREK